MEGWWVGCVRRRLKHPQVGTRPAGPVGHETALRRLGACEASGYGAMSSRARNCVTVRRWLGRGHASMPAPVTTKWSRCSFQACRSRQCSRFSELLGKAARRRSSSTGAPASPGTSPVVRLQWLVASGEVAVIESDDNPGWPGEMPHTLDVQGVRPNSCCFAAPTNNLMSIAELEPMDGCRSPRRPHG